MTEIPFQAWWGGVTADAYWRYLVRAGVIKPRKARSKGRVLVVTGDPAKNGNFNPAITRTLRAIVKASGIKPGKGDKQNLQLLYDLASWLINHWGQGGNTPKRALSTHVDYSLIEILQRYGKISAGVFGWEELDSVEKDKLEKRLYLQWPIVERVASAIQAPAKQLSSSKRRPRSSMQNMAIWVAGRRNILTK